MDDDFVVVGDPHEARADGEEVDLTDQEAAGPSDPLLHRWQIRDVHLLRESWRGWVALIALLPLVLLILCTVVSLIAGWTTMEEVGFLYERLLPALLALSSAVAGFYFGRRE